MSNLIIYTINIFTTLMCVAIAILADTKKEKVIWTVLGGINLLSTIDIGIRIVEMTM